MKYFLLLLFFFSSWIVYAQDNDDLYFSSKDRELLHKNDPKQKKEKEIKKRDTLIVDPSLKELTWKLSCKGLTTQFEKTFQGHSQNFSEAYKFISDSLKAFYRSEKISVAFTFDSTSAIITDTIEWNGLKDFFSSQFITISDCEKMHYSYPEWLTPLIVEKGTLFTIDKSLAPPQGESCLKISGQRVGNICSFSKYFKNEYSNSYVSIKSPESTAEDTWIFFYAYGSGDSTDILQLMVYQTIYKKGVTVTILQKAYTYKLPLDFNGWKQFAVRYSDLQVPEGMQDNEVRNPKNLSSIEFSLAGGAPEGKTSVYLDQLMILANK